MQRRISPLIVQQTPCYGPAMTWIATIGREEAASRLREAYDRIAGPHGVIDNILLAHSLRPHTLTGHLGLYKAVLHHSQNRLPVPFLETIGVQVSHLNGCAYCVDHHSAGLRKLLGDDDRHATIVAASTADRPDEAFEGRELAALDYTRRLTESPRSISEVDVEALRRAGFDDGEILGDQPGGGLLRLCKPHRARPGHHDRRRRPRHGATAV